MIPFRKILHLHVFSYAVFYTAIGFLRLGWLVNYLSAPVISGFMTGKFSNVIYEFNSGLRRKLLGFTVAIILSFF